MTVQHLKSRAAPPQGFQQPLLGRVAPSRLRPLLAPPRPPPPRAVAPPPAGVGPFPSAPATTRPLLVLLVMCNWAGTCSCCITGRERPKALAARELPLLRASSYRLPLSPSAASAASSMLPAVLVVSQSLPAPTAGAERSLPPAARPSLSPPLPLLPPARNTSAGYYARPPTPGRGGTQRSPTTPSSPSPSCPPGGGIWRCGGGAACMFVSACVSGAACVRVRAWLGVIACVPMCGPVCVRVLGCSICALPPGGTRGGCGDQALELPNTVTRSPSPAQPPPRRLGGEPGGGPTTSSYGPPPRRVPRHPPGGSHGCGGARRWSSWATPPAQPLLLWGPDGP